MKPKLKKLKNKQFNSKGSKKSQSKSKGKGKKCPNLKLLPKLIP